MGLDLPRPPKGSFSWSAARSGHKDNEALALPALATMVCRITNGSALLPDVDGRSPWVRRCKDIVAAHLSDLSVARITPARPRAASSDALPAGLPASDAIGTRDSVSDKPRVTIGQVAREAHARRVLIPIGVSSPKEATSPKGRVPPSPKSNFAAFSGKGHTAIFEFHVTCFFFCTMVISFFV